MKSRVRFVFACIAGLALAAALAALGCSSAAPSSSSAGQSSPGSSAASTSSSAADVPSAVTIALDYSAGTGYDWSYSAEPEGVLALTDHATEGESGDEPVAGGSLRDKFEFKALAPGEVTLTFNLVRSWETEAEPANTQVYAFTVNDELEIILNPYKSNFENEPVIGMDA